jgi:hypothetical protein
MSKATCAADSAGCPYLIVGPNGLRKSLHLEKTPGYAEQILRNFSFGPADANQFCS